MSNFLDFRNSKRFVEELIYLGHGVVSLLFEGSCFLCLQVLPWISELFKMKELRSSETSVTSYSTTQRFILEQSDTSIFHRFRSTDFFKWLCLRTLSELRCAFGSELLTLLDKRASYGVLNWLADSNWWKCGFRLTSIQNICLSSNGGLTLGVDPSLHAANSRSSPVPPQVMYMPHGFFGKIKIRRKRIFVAYETQVT